MKSHYNRVTLIDCGDKDILECMKQANDIFNKLGLYPEVIDKTAYTIKLKTGTQIIFVSNATKDVLVPIEADVSESSLFTFEKFVGAFDSIKEEV